jgi:hypothetical protein
MVLLRTTGITRGPPSRGGPTCRVYEEPRASSRWHVWPKEWIEAACLGREDCVDVEEAEN